VENGADAVYAGFTSFSARTYADNFSLPELLGVIRESKTLGVKVYIAFNSLIKEDELPQAFKTLMTLAAFEPDAFIVQDLGLAQLAQKLCPQIPLHASTLTAVYNRTGLTALKKLGFSRAVLPRELSLKEIETLAQSDILPLEVFIHGSMCFSFSGLCLFSSFLGGRSALRGGCAQPCRRAFKNSAKTAPLFSAADLEATEVLPILKSWPIAALKIEGRMKGPEYVGPVVKAYRLLLDAQPNDWAEALTEAQGLLREIALRPVGGGFFLGPSQALTAQGASGLKVGYLTPLSLEEGQVTLEREIRLLDRLRLVPSPGQEGLAFKLRKILLNGQEVTEAPQGATVTLVPGLKPITDPQTGKTSTLKELKGVLYLASSGQLEKEYLAKDPIKRILKGRESYKPLKVALPKELEAKAAPKDRYPFAKHLWYWVGDLDNLGDLLKYPPEKLVITLNPANARAFGRFKKLLAGSIKVVWSFPALLFAASLEKTKREAVRLIDQGFREFMVANLGEAELLTSLSPNLKIWGDHRLGPLNHLSEKALSRLGLTGITLSPEMDEATYQGLTRRPLASSVLLYLFGRPALFTSRFFPKNLKRGPIISPKGEKFLAGLEGDAFIIRSESRIFMGGLLKGPSPANLAGLLVDLRQESRVGELAKSLKKAVAEGRGNLGLSFNFKRGLR
jgi:putative protease